MFDQHQEVAKYLAVRNRKRVEQEAAGPLPELPPNVPQPRWARLRALLGSIAPRRPAPRPGLRSGQMRAERR